MQLDLVPDDDGRKRAVDASAPPQRCSYCNAPLNSFLYFCTGCGTPYKDVSSVITQSMPRQLTEGELIKLQAPAVWPMFITYAAVLIISSIIVNLFMVDNEPALSLVLMEGVLLTTTCIYMAVYWKSLVVQFKTFGFINPYAWIAILALIPTLALNYVYHQFVMELIRRSGEPIIDPLAGVSDDMVMMILVFCVFPAVIEEIAFRGLIQHWLQIAIKPWRALVLASFLFAVMHFSVLSLPYLFLVGMLLGWAKMKTGSLYPSMLIHFLHNWFVVVYMHG